MKRMDEKDIQLGERYLEMVRDILCESLSGIQAEAYLFGSRANGSAKRASDIDIAVSSDISIESRISNIREKIHESHIPYTADIVDMSTIHKKLRKSILSGGLLIWKN